MKLQGNQALNQFVAIATTATTIWTTSNAIVSARIGGKSSSSSSQKQNLRKAPTKIGFDPTAPVVESNTVGVEFTQPLRNRKVVVPKEPSQQRYQFQQRRSIQEVEKEENRIRNETTNNSSNNVPINEDDDCVTNLDTGVLICGSKAETDSSSSGTPSRTPSRTPPVSDKTITTPATEPIAINGPTEPITIELMDLLKKRAEEVVDEPGHDVSCRIGYVYDDDFKLMEAGKFLDETGDFDITFDPQTQTITCDGYCHNLVFDHCDVKCDTEMSCYNTRIQDASKVECNGEESCSKAHIDAYHVSCTAERSCQEAYIGDNQFTYTLECTAEESCSWVTTSQVDDVHCTGPAACYGAYLGGVNSRVTCQSLPHEDGYYQPTCGGDKGFIEAADDKSIKVLCNGDFSCIGYGHDPYDESIEHPIYFDVDVGSRGELVCEGSLVGNHDGGTYVCRYIDIIQGCGNYECHEPTGFNEVNDYRTCNHIFSIHHHELCYEGPGVQQISDDDDDDVDDDDDDDDVEVEEDEDDDKIDIITTAADYVVDDSDQRAMTQHFYTSTVKLIFDPYGNDDEDDDDDDSFDNEADEYAIDEVGLIEVPAEMMRDLFHHHVVNKVI